MLKGGEIEELEADTDLSTGVLVGRRSGKDLSSTETDKFAPAHKLR